MVVLNTFSKKDFRSRLIVYYFEFNSSFVDFTPLVFAVISIFPLSFVVRRTIRHLPLTVVRLLFCHGSSENSLELATPAIVAAPST
jgi:hypothetical protein